MPFWLLVGASCVALAIAVLTLTTGTVEANALLSRPTAATPANSVTSPTPVQTEEDKAKDGVPGSQMHGVASWYGSRFNGRTTASGERFNMYAMTAAHPTLPFGTRVRVMNMTNHKSVVVRITDRGYLPDARVLDLSYGAAQKLAMTKDGVVPVKIQVIRMGKRE